jgi:hypothetical protein
MIQGKQALYHQYVNIISTNDKETKKNLPSLRANTVIYDCSSCER